jgi:hypothetical protein
MKKLILISTMILCNTAIFAQNNPYAMMGYVNLTPDYYAILNAEEDVAQQNFMYLYNTDTTSEVQILVFNFANAKVYALNAKNEILQEAVFELSERAISPDPHWFKYPHHSAYMYCAGNPIMYRDPTGMDEWDIDEQGNVVCHDNDPSADIIRVVDNDGNVKNDANGNQANISLPYGTIQHKTNTFSTDGKSVSPFEIFKVKGDANGTAFFELMANNTNVEWSHAKTGIAGAKGLNFLTTSHSATTEIGISILYDNQLVNQYFVREINHNHPSGIPIPAGMPGTTGNDIAFAEAIEYNNSVWGYKSPNFNVYAKGWGYSGYTSKSRVSDFSSIIKAFGITLK